MVKYMYTWLHLWEELLPPPSPQFMYADASLIYIVTDDCIYITLMAFN